MSHRQQAHLGPAGHVRPSEPRMGGTCVCTSCCARSGTWARVGGHVGVSAWGHIHIDLCLCIGGSVCIISSTRVCVCVGILLQPGLQVKVCVCPFVHPHIVPGQPPGWYSLAVAVPSWVCSGSGSPPPAQQDLYLQDAFYQPEPQLPSYFHRNRTFLGLPDPSHSPRPATFCTTPKLEPRCPSNSHPLPSVSFQNIPGPANSLLAWLLISAVPPGTSPAAWVVFPQLPSLILAAPAPSPTGPAFSG